MENIVQVAIELGYLTVGKDVLVPVDQISKYPNEKNCCNNNWKPGGTNVCSCKNGSIGA